MHPFRSKRPALDDRCEFSQTRPLAQWRVLGDLDAWGVMWGATRLIDGSRN
jgi:hypothetical protein